MPEGTALPLERIKAVHQRKQGKADMIVMQPLDGRISQVVKDGLVNTQLHVCFSGDFVVHAHYVWQPYIAVKTRPAPLSALAARRELA